MKILPITQEQIDLLAEEFAEISIEDESGHPGMLVCQVVEDGMRCGVLNGSASTVLLRQMGLSVSSYRSYANSTYLDYKVGV